MAEVLIGTESLHEMCPANSRRLMKWHPKIPLQERWPSDGIKAVRQTWRVAHFCSIQDKNGPFPGNLGISC